MVELLSHSEKRKLKFNPLLNIYDYRLADEIPLVVEQMKNEGETDEKIRQVVLEMKIKSLE